jgi:hypothetical protein
MKVLVPVNSPFTLEELVHSIDVSVNSKYGADLEGITRTIMDSVRGPLESLRLEFKRESECLPRQVRAVVQQVLGEAREKHDSEAVDVAAGAGVSTEMAFCSPGSTSRPTNLGGTSNTNFEQPYYQVNAYEPGGHPVTGTYGVKPTVLVTPPGGGGYLLACQRTLESKSQGPLGNLSWSRKGGVEPIQNSTPSSLTRFLTPEVLGFLIL